MGKVVSAIAKCYGGRVLVVCARYPFMCSFERYVESCDGARHESGFGDVVIRAEMMSVVESTGFWLEDGDWHCECGVLVGLVSSRSQMDSV